MKLILAAVAVAVAAVLGVAVPASAATGAPGTCMFHHGSPGC